MKNIFFIFTIIVFFGGCSEDPIQPVLFGKIQGEVKTADTFSPIEMAEVSTSPATSIVFTDSLGQFDFGDVPEGDYTVQVDKAGFVTKIEPVSVQQDNTTKVTIQLVEDAQINHSPQLPEQPSPANFATGLPLNFQASWVAKDEDKGDTLHFDVLLFSSDLSQETLVGSNLSDTLFEFTNLDFDRNYLWQVVVKDGHNPPVHGEVWQFRTIPFPDNRFHFVREENGKPDVFSSNGMGNDIRLTANDGSNWRPRLNPQRTKIAYISNIGVNPQLYTMNRDGSNSVQITNISIDSYDSYDLDYSWSPDGSKLLYMHFDRLYLVNQDGSGTTLLAQLTDGSVFSGCDWSPFGGKIALRTTGTFGYQSSILLMDEASNFLDTLVQDEPGSTGNPDFSIDGTKILYSHDVSGLDSQDGRQLDAHIFLLDLASKNVTDLSQDKPAGTNDLEPRFSPTGAVVIFSNSNNDGLSPKNIWVMDLSGQNRLLLFENAEMPDWQ